MESTAVLIAEIASLREALLRITNLSGGCSIEDAKRIAVSVLDRAYQEHPVEKMELFVPSRNP